MKERKKREGTCPPPGKTKRGGEQHSRRRRTAIAILRLLLCDWVQIPGPSCWDHAVHGIPLYSVPQEEGR